MANEVLAEDAQRSGNATEGTVEEEATWLRNTTEKLAVVYLASQQGHAGSESGESDFVDHAAIGPQVVANREVEQRLHQLIDELPNQVAMLIRTIYFEGATLDRAATQLGISKSWASRLHARALEQLGASLRRLGVE
jgi:RNA polymerase sigma factor for flagellar operon FliA